MQKFIDQVNTLKRNTPSPSQLKLKITKEINSATKIININDAKRHLEQTWGIQRSYRSKKEYLLAISMMQMKNQLTEKDKHAIIDEFLYEEEIFQIRRFYTKNNNLSAYKKTQDRKLIAEIVKDCYKKELEEIFLKKCGFPFSFRAKDTLVDLIFMAIFEKPTYHLRSRVFVPEEEECAICSSEITEGHALECACPYFYHKECLQKWLDLNPSCPTCRKLV